MFPETVCPECGRVAKVVKAKRDKDGRKYVFKCFFCFHEWDEKLRFFSEDSKKGREIDSILLGAEIDAAAERCFELIEGACFSAIYDEVECLKNRLSDPKNIQKLEKLEKFIPKIERISKERAEKECLKEIKYLKNLLSGLEDHWGLKKFKEILDEYEHNIRWGRLGLEDFFEEAEGKCKEEAEKILKYLDAVTRSAV